MGSNPIRQHRAKSRAEGSPRSSRTTSSLRPLLLALSLALAAAAIGASVAQASPAKFTYELCDSALPGGASPGLQFVVNPGVPIGYFDTCAQPGGAVGVQEWGHTASTFAYLSVSVPETPGGFVETDTISAAAGALGQGNDHTFVYEQAWPQNNEGEQRRTFFIRRERAFLGNGGSFDLLMNCDGNYGPGCEAGPTIWAHDIAATEVDPTPPTLTGLGGSLLAASTMRGHQSIEVEGHDEGGGLSKIEVLVNGLLTGPPKAGACNLAQVDNRSYEGTVALTTTPCPTKLKAEWTLDTETYPFHDGANAVQVCASDFSTLDSPNTTCSPLKIVNVDNSCTNSPVSGGELLSAQFTKSNKETLTVGYGKEAEVTGQLTTNAGDPVPGATLCVKMQTLGVNARASTVGTVTTDANGNYSYKVPAGPNREIVIGYRHDTVQIARDVRYYAHTKPRLKAGPEKLENGERVRLWGSVPGPRAAERVVVLQANVPGSHRWITFRKATTGRRGHFHARYHFTSTTRTITYRFRALVPVQAGYPWVQGASKPTPVKVRK